MDDSVLDIKLTSSDEKLALNNQNMFVILRSNLGTFAQSNYFNINPETRTINEEIQLYIIIEYHYIQ